MAGRAIQRPPSISALAGEPDVAQLLSAVQELQRGRRRAVLRADLVIGTNVLRHGLGRAVEGYGLTPTVASAAFAHAIDATNPNPELELWLVVIGAAQPGARVEVW